MSKKKIIAINGSLRCGGNTDILVREAAAGAAFAGAEAEFIDLYQLEKFTGCISCFGCETEAHLGKCDARIPAAKWALRKKRSFR